VACDVVARLSLSRLKLDDILDVELSQLQQQEVDHRRTSTPSDGSCSMSSQPAPSSSSTSRNMSSQPPSSSPVSRAVSGGDGSQPFELPDVNISDLLNLTVQSPASVRSSLVDRQGSVARSSPASAATLLTSQRLSSMKQRANGMTAGSRQRGTDNCRQNSVRNDDISGQQAATIVTSGVSQKRQSRRRCSSTADSDDEFVDSQRHSRCVKKRADDCCKSPATVEVVQKTDVECSSKLGLVTDSPPASRSRVGPTVSNSPAADSLQLKVAQRLSKFAFSDTGLRQRQESTSVTSHSRTIAERHGTGD